MYRLLVFKIYKRIFQIEFFDSKEILFVIFSRLLLKEIVTLCFLRQLLHDAPGNNSFLNKKAIYTCHFYSCNYWNINDS